MRYDLKLRTAKFGRDVIKFCGTLPRNEITRSLISQLIRAATSVGANYLEADDASSVKDFRYKISLCNREAKESRHWLEMLRIATPDFLEAIDVLGQEAGELNLIFSAISRSQERNNNN